MFLDHLKRGSFQTLYRPLALYAGSILLGFGANFVTVHILYGTQFIFGSIFTFLIYRNLGLRYSLVASIIISIPTFFLWGHPYAVIIFVAELAVTGFLHRRIINNLLLANSIYWILVGIPLVFVFYYYFLGIGFDQVAVIMGKQPANGLFNIFISNVLFHFFPMDWKKPVSEWNRKVSIRSVLVNLLTGFIIIPLVIFLFFYSRSEMQRANDSLLLQLDRRSEMLTNLFKGWIRHEPGVIYTMLTELKSGRSHLIKHIETDELIEGVLMSDPGSGKDFLYPPDLGRRLPQILKEDKNSIRMGTDGNWYLLLSHLLEKDQTHVVVVMNLKHFTDLLMEGSGRYLNGLVILDSQDQLVFSNLPESRFKGWPGPGWREDARKVAPGVYLSSADQSGLLMRMWADSVYIKEVPPDSQIPMKLLAVEPLSSYIDQFQRLETRGLITLFLFTILGVWIASSVGSLIVSPLNRLAETSTDIPEKLIKNEKPEFKRNVFLELDSLSENFQMMTDELGSRIHTIQDINRDLEDMVKERTITLHEANQELSLEVSRRKDIEKQLQRMNRGLELRVEEEVARRRGQEQVLIHQSRLAAMGEMLGAIAHQWRQPLNSVGIILQMMEELQESGELTKETLHSRVYESMDMIRSMSRTIDDFRTFFKPRHEMEDISIFDTLLQIQNLLKEQMEYNGIHLEVTAGNELKSIQIPGFGNEFKQVLINLINNSREAIQDRLVAANNGEKETGLIRIGLQYENGEVRIPVTDNGGGIKSETGSRIFDPYFTTRRTGAGIGLYMARIIIEERMSGKLVWENTKTGCTFTIILFLTGNDSGVQTISPESHDRE